MRTAALLLAARPGLHVALAARATSVEPYDLARLLPRQIALIEQLAAGPEGGLHSLSPPGFYPEES